MSEMFSGGGEITPLRMGSDIGALVNMILGSNSEQDLSRAQAATGNWYAQDAATGMLASFAKGGQSANSDDVGIALGAGAAAKDTGAYLS